MFDITPADLENAQTQALLRLHLEGMHAASPPGTVFALDLSGLRAAGVDVWSVWAGARIAAIGALKTLDATSGELKSMRTHPDFLRQGAASRLLDHMLAVARSRHWRRVSLETGTGAAFEPALALYRARGFCNGPPFADYAASSFNQFLHLDLAPPAGR